MEVAAADRENGGGHGHRIEVSLLPLKKRALNDSSSDRGSSPDDSYSPPPKKRRAVVVDGCVGAAESKDAGDLAAPAVPRQRRSAPASPEPAAKGAALSAAKKWLEKGKWIAAKAEEFVSGAPQPPAKKLMHDGIRSFAELNERHAAQAAAAAAAAAARDERNRSDVPRPIADDADLGEALRRRLAELGATRPWFVYQKKLQKSDVCPNQNRLLVSCKRETLERCPITACFSPDEWLRVENRQVGLSVQALDRDAVFDKLTCKFLDSNGGYRFITGWKDLLKRNGMELDSRGRWTRDVDVELWAFRSRALELLQPRLDADGKPVKPPKEDMDEKEKKKIMYLQGHLHPDGSLGLILLHHEHRRRHVEPDDGDADDDEGMAPPVARAKGKKQREKKRDASAPAPPSPVARRGVGAEPSGPSGTLSELEMANEYGESRADALKGIMIFKAGDNVDGEHGA